MRESVALAVDDVFWLRLWPTTLRAHGRGDAMSTVFPTCIADTLRPALGARIVAWLRHRGEPATLARGVSCCGQPAFNAGYTDEARRVARRSLRALAKTTGPIVVPSGSCAAMMAKHWPGLFAGTRHENAAREVAGRIVEFSAHAAGSSTTAPGHTTPDNTARKETVAYLASCHLTRELGVRDEPVSLLRAHGHDVVYPEHTELCCGFGGTFSVKYPAVSAAMADEKIDTLCATAASAVVGCDLSCLMHLAARAGARGVALPFRHIGEVLDD